MAVSGVVCKSRLFFRIEIRNILCNPAILKRNLFNDSKRKWRECRKLTTSLPLAEKHKRKNDEKDTKVDDETVTVSYHQGLPQITVPLPSRRELCRFTLRPVSHTVGDFLNMLRDEDKGIERSVAMCLDGTRIASSDPIESLLEADFHLIINNLEYKVSVPRQSEPHTPDQQLGDVRDLVHRLYAALHVQDHQILKERELQSRLEQLQMQLQPMEQIRDRLEAQAQRRGNFLAWTGLGLMSVQFGILARLTWWEYSWDIMEPVTYFVTYGTAMAAYAYFVLTKEEYILPDVKDRQHLFTLHKRARKTGLDLAKYNALKEQVSALERDLQRLRDPLQLHLPTAPSPKQLASAAHS